MPNGLGTADQLYRNDGAGSFQEIAASAGLASTANDRGAIWFDRDGDGVVDLLVGGDRYGLETPVGPAVALRLYAQRVTGTYRDVTREAGLHLVPAPAQQSHFGGLCAADLSGDGFLDLFTGWWEGSGHLFENDGQGGFADRTATSGLVPALPFWQTVAHDFDGDGRLDLFQAIDFLPNRLWLNQGGMTFVDAAPAAGVDNAMNDMGIALGDPDLDGDFEVYVTNIHGIGEHHVFFENHTAGGRPSFTEIAPQLGVEAGGIGWGTSFLDADRDGLVDLAAATAGGHHSLFFHNTGGAQLSFADAAAAVGFTQDLDASGLAAFDADRDGDLDLVQACAYGGPLQLLDCQSGAAAAARHWLVVRPRMPGPNRRAIGAVVRVRLGTRWQSRAITAGTSILGQEPAEAHFGLGSAAVADEVLVQWPGGGETRLFAVGADQVLTVLP